MDIKVGEYVRDNVGYILYIDNDFILENIKRFIKGTAIAKHSKNLINLIEAGDIVNNGYIYEVGKTGNGHKWVHSLNGLLLFEEDIETILTKEQMEANCYK